MKKTKRIWDNPYPMEMIQYHLWMHRIRQVPLTTSEWLFEPLCFSAIDSFVRPFLLKRQSLLHFAFPVALRWLQDRRLRHPYIVQTVPWFSLFALPEMHRQQVVPVSFPLHPNAAAFLILLVSVLSIRTIFFCRFHLAAPFVFEYRMQCVLLEFIINLIFLIANLLFWSFPKLSS